VTWWGLGKPAQTYAVRICQLSALDEHKGRPPLSADNLLFELGQLRAVRCPTKAHKAKAEEIIRVAMKSEQLVPANKPGQTWYLAGEPGLLRQPAPAHDLQFPDLDACWHYWRGHGRPYGTSARQRINMHTYERSGME